MSDYPGITALLLKLMQVEGTDTLLPLPVLINLHKRVLRAPLERLVASMPELEKLADESFLLNTRVSERWPVLQDGALYREHETLDSLSARAPEEVPQEFSQWITPLLNRVLELSMWEWQAYEPLALLHQLTWPRANREVLLEMLEIELALDPAVRDLMDHYAAPDSGVADA